MNSIRFDTQTITPSKVVCIGRNYVDHAKELNNEVPTSPVIFLKPNSAICNELYAGTEQTLHYEGEIALLIIGGEIAGAGFGLDLTNRDIQNQLKEKGLPWERAKAFDRAAVFSAFVPLTQPLESLRLELDINGARAQQGGYPLMIFKPEFLLQEISRFFTLEDGDIIMTGTPKGVGAFRQGDQFKGSIFSGDTLLVSQEWTAQ
ncbi:MAG: fumarylacetoacetate hydrolase family protein [Sedimenticola sp.]|nr:fumarylacetoacetate hydrolase family protein [Sedimenticola sp.]MCW8946730.1 fumarylacetoacetate hydrolase family protein [Sedimenticola sp.]MCW8976304.1 fumarylacetoacetate hydrolase family protein [Sedimenticola sp.]MCW9022215.1 fumarylacetoacetate hydrolase family protein [Sedimenticola sp.]